MLHELACSGPEPGTGCVCPPGYEPPATGILADVTTWSHVDGYISNVETLLMALEQRPLDKHQSARLRLILDRSHRRIR